MSKIMQYQIEDSMSISEWTTLPVADEDGIVTIRLLDGGGRAAYIRLYARDEFEIGDRFTDGTWTVEIIDSPREGRDRGGQNPRVEYPVRQEDLIDGEVFHTFRSESSLRRVERL